jgi:hypothetical protein
VADLPRVRDKSRAGRRSRLRQAQLRARPPSSPHTRKRPRRYEHVFAGSCYVVAILGQFVVAEHELARCRMSTVGNAQIPCRSAGEPRHNFREYVGSPLFEAFSAGLLVRFSCCVGQRRRRHRSRRPAQPLQQRAHRPPRPTPPAPAAPRWKRSCSTRTSGRPGCDCSPGTPTAGSGTYGSPRDGRPSAGTGR